MLGIYGCGGMGREIAELARRIGRWQGIIFIDDRPGDREVDRVKVFTLEEAGKKFKAKGLEVIISVGEPATRKALAAEVAAAGLQSARVIAPGFELSPTSTVAPGTLIHSGVVATCNVHIAEGCLINKLAVIGHDVTIGSFSVISPHVAIGGNTRIGPGCFLGSGALIRDGVNIGPGAIIGMGAVVLSDVERDAVMVGNPARFLRENRDKKALR